MVETEYTHEVEGGLRRRVSEGAHVQNRSQIIGVSYSVVIITNQALRSGALTEWKKKVPYIGAAASSSRR